MNHTYAIDEHAEIDLTLSENPLGVSPKVIRAIAAAAKKMHLYPDQEKRLVALLAQHHGVVKESILLGAGANQLLEDYLKVFAIGKKIVVPMATFPESVACMTTLRGSAHLVPLRETFELDLEALLQACDGNNTSFIHLCNPNNPTGIWTKTSHLLQLAKRSHVPVLVSEAGADFVGCSLLDRRLPANLIVVRSFSKAYGLAGLRVGYSVASPEIIATMKRHLRSYRVSSIALIAAIAALEDQEHLQRSLVYILQEKSWLMRAMSCLGFQVVPSQGQTFIAKVPKEFQSADQFCAVAKQHQIALVNCALYPGLDQYVRVSPQRRGINKKFISTLKLIIGGK